MKPQLINRPALAAVISGVSVVHLVTAWTHGGPVAVPDVTAYLNISQRLWGALPIGDLPYHPGYGILVGVFGFLDADALHTAALCVNVLLFGVVVWIVPRVMCRLGASALTQWAGVALTCLHPSLTYGSRVAWPETLLVVVLLLVAVSYTHLRAHET